MSDTHKVTRNQLLIWKEKSRPSAAGGDVIGNHPCLNSFVSIFRGEVVTSVWSLRVSIETHKQFNAIKLVS